MTRVTLPNAETRIKDMENIIASVAKSILDDFSGDAVFQNYLKIKANVHRYSIGNQMLMLVQAPDSALVASKTAFAKMAAAQGHDPLVKTSNKGKTYEEFVHIESGCKAVWIWGAPRPCTYLREIKDEAGEPTKQPVTFNKFFPADVWPVEGIRYSDTNEPFVLPTFVQPVEDLNLYDACLAFAAHKGITVTEEGLGGAAGVSKGGAIATQAGQTWQENVPVLLHELAHELLHPLQERDKLTREIKEAEAEATCAVVLQHFGHGTGPQSAYLRNWKATPKDVIDSMGRIAKAAAEIVDFVMDNQHEDEQEVAA